jgi:hypothetical protein
MFYLNKNYSQFKIDFLLIAIAFLIKLSLVIYIVHLRKCNYGNVNNLDTILASQLGDTPSYFDPFDNFLEKGEYFITYHTKLQGPIKVEMGRGPYYGFIYFIFRLFFSKEVSQDLIVIFQILIEAFSIVYLCKLTYNITKIKYVFWITYFLMLISFDTTCHSFLLMTESLSTSFLIFTSYHYYNYLEKKKNKDLFITGIFLAFVVALKPYFSLFYILIGIKFLLDKPFLIKNVISKTLIISIPLIILITPYTIRNYIKFQVFQPFSELYAGYPYTKADLEYREFIKAWGGTFISWNRRSAGCFFESQDFRNCEFKFPYYAFCKGYKIDDVLKARKIYLQYLKNPSKSLEDSVIKSFSTLTQLYKENCPFRYYFLSRFSTTKTFLFHSGSYYLPINKKFPCYKSYQFLIKLFQSFLYYYSLIFGIIGLLILYFNDKKTYLISIIPFYLILFFPIILKATEFRYFSTSYPFLMFGAVYITVVFLKNVFKIST